MKRLIELVAIVALVTTCGCRTQMLTKDEKDLNWYGRLVKIATGAEDAQEPEPKPEPEPEPEPVEEEIRPDMGDRLMTGGVQWIGSGQNAVAIVEADDVGVYRGDGSFVNGGVRDGNRWTFDLSGRMLDGLYLHVERNDAVEVYAIGNGGEDGLL